MYPRQGPAQNRLASIKATHQSMSDDIGATVRDTEKGTRLGTTHVEAAEKLNMPLGTLKTKCRKALCEMRGVFSED